MRSLFCEDGEKGGVCFGGQKVTREARWPSGAEKERSMREGRRRGEEKRGDRREEKRREEMEMRKEHNTTEQTRALFTFLDPHSRFL